MDKRNKDSQSFMITCSKKKSAVRVAIKLNKDFVENLCLVYPRSTELSKNLKKIVIHKLVRDYFYDSSSDTKILSYKEYKR